MSQISQLSVCSRPTQTAGKRPQGWRKFPQWIFFFFMGEMTVENETTKVDEEEETHGVDHKCVTSLLKGLLLVYWAVATHRSGSPASKGFSPKQHHASLHVCGSNWPDQTVTANNHLTHQMECFTHPSVVTSTKQLNGWKSRDALRRNLDCDWMSALSVTFKLDQSADFTTAGGSSFLFTMSAWNLSP